MRIDRLLIADFKNLRDFTIDFDEGRLTTVLIGQNGTGKSNLFEALVLIFRALDLNDDPPFGYTIRYTCRGRSIEVVGTPTHKKTPYTFNVDGIAVTRTAFHRDRGTYLPQHVFAYYSGPSQRLASHFDKHLERFYRDSREGKTDELRRLFLCRGVHSHFVLLAFYAFEDKASRDILKEHLGLVGLDSVLFVLKKPHWFKKRTGSKRVGRRAPGSEERFFGARGMVRDFLDRAWGFALAPLYHEELVRDDYRSQTTREERLYLFIQDQDALSALAATFGEPKTFFANLETTDLSDLIREVRIRVQREGVAGFLTFKELSEGEQQLLAVLGLLKFTKEEESLFLLDEPDTHLNPVWKRNYLNLLQNVVALGEESHLLIATHDPLVVGGLHKEEVRVLVRRERGRIDSIQPDEDPKGMGFAGLLKSELFGLRSTLDPETLGDLDRRYELMSKGQARTKADETELAALAERLDGLGFGQEFRDPYFEQFVKAMAAQPEFRKPVLSEADRTRVAELSRSMVATLLKEETK